MHSPIPETLPCLPWARGGTGNSDRGREGTETQPQPVLWIWQFTANTSIWDKFRWFLLMLIESKPWEGWSHQHPCHLPSWRAHLTKHAAACRCWCALCGANTNANTSIACLHRHASWKLSLLFLDNNMTSITVRLSVCQGQHQRTRGVSTGGSCLCWGCTQWFKVS